MKKLSLAFVIGIVLALAGCAGMGRPTEQQLATADYGPQITQAEAQQKIIAYFKRTLLDPGSAILRTDTRDPQKHWMSDNLGNYHYGYATNASINAKNAYGGYVGETLYVFIFYRGEIFRISQAFKSDGRYYPDLYTFAPYPAALGRQR